MALATLAELKSRLGNITKTTDDAFLQQLLDEHSAIVEMLTGRSFTPNPPLASDGTDTLPVVTLTIDAAYRGTISIPDARVVTAISMDGNPLVAQDYRLVGDRAGGVPVYHDLILQPLAGITPGWARAGWQTGWAVGRTLTITGRFGIWPVPPEIKGACLLMCARAYKEKDARYSDLVELPDGSAVHYYRSQLPPRVSMVLDNYAVQLVA